MRDDGEVPTSRTKATLRIGHERLTAAAVTRLLGLEPSHSHEVGQPRSTRSPAPWRASQWSLESPLPDGEPLNAHLAWLCGQVGDQAEALVQLDADGYSLDCFCFVDVLNGQGGVSVSPEVMASLGQLRVELDLDIYASSDDT